MTTLFNDDAIVLTKDIKERIKAELKAVLIREHSDPKKHEVYEASGRLNFACPYCGDSTDDSYKKRGNLFWDSLYFHCYNGGCVTNGKTTHRTIVQFFKDFNSSLSDDDYFTYLKYIKDHKLVTGEVDQLEFQVLKELDDLSVKRTELIKYMNLYEINEKTYRIFPYLKSRLLHLKLKNFLWDPRKKQLYILNNNHDNTKVYGYQIRNLGVDKPTFKYLSYNITKLRENVGLTTEIEETKLERLNNLSLLMGISFLDMTQEFTIFEGPIDSMFMKNSLAICGLNKELFSFDDIPTSRYLLDNDYGGIQKMIEKIKKGKKVFLWRKLLDENKIKVRIKDLNDLIIYMYKNKIRINLNSYFSDDPYDIIYIGQ